MKFAKILLPMLLANISFAGVEFSSSAQLIIKRTLDVALPLKQGLSSKDNGAMLCFEKFARDMESVSNNINALLQNEKYANIKLMIEVILESAKKDPDLAQIKREALSANTPEAWQKLKIETYHFIGSLMEAKLPKRFSKQLPGERDFSAWLNRNEKLDLISDFDDFIAGFVGQFYVAEIITSH